MHVASKYVFIEMCLILRVASAVVKPPAAGASTLYGFTICNASPKRHPRETAPDALVCPHCHSGSIYRHDRFARMGCLLIKRLKLTMLRYRCCCCGRTFCSDARVLGLAKWARRNKPLNDSIISASADDMSNKRIAARFHLSQSTVERQLHRSHKAMLKEQLAYPLPRQLGIDEHSIHRGGKYAVTLVDLEHHRVYDVIEGKNAALLAARLRKMD